MSLKDDLIRNGYLPENMPPSFQTQDVGDFFDTNPISNFYSRSNSPVRAAIYNASKRGLTRRPFAAVHPSTAYDLAEFVSTRWRQILRFFNRSNFSLSLPTHLEGPGRALRISSHNDLESNKFSRLSHYRFIAKTDISRFYHSIYTHSIPWAYHGKVASKADRDVRSTRIFMNRADHIIRCGQDGQTVGIPVGPDTSRVFAEILGTAIDLEFVRRCDVDEYSAVRHVDDVWIGANSHADAERALWRYREAIREFELDINENKTRIYAEDFRFADGWPTDIASRFEFALNSPRRRMRERLRAAFEYAFTFASEGGDDGVLKYAIRYLDQSDLHWSHWNDVEPFLKRAAVHFGHTVDYVVRVIVWRHLVYGDLDTEAWRSILLTILDKHGRLGNDSEVCWSLYACMRLEIDIEDSIATHIINNCGGLAITSLLTCVELGIAGRANFSACRRMLTSEDANGQYWPVILEWKSREWPRHRSINVENDLISSMADQGVTLIDSSTLPPVFDDVEEDEFDSIDEAIESHISDYDDEDDDDEDPFGRDLDF